MSSVHLGLNLSRLCPRVNIALTLLDALEEELEGLAPFQMKNIY